MHSSEDQGPRYHRRVVPHSAFSVPWIILKGEQQYLELVYARKGVGEGTLMASRSVCTKHHENERIKPKNQIHGAAISMSLIGKTHRTIEQRVTSKL